MSGGTNNFDNETFIIKFYIMANIVLLGPPGAGKGTQAKKIINHYQLSYVVPGDLMRAHIRQGTEIGKSLTEYIDAGMLAPHELVMQLVHHQILADKDKGRHFLFDGFPRAIAQAISLDELLQQHNYQLDGIIFIDLPDEIARARIRKRAKVSGRNDDQSDEKINKRLQVYREETLPVIAHYKNRNQFHHINGVGEEEAVFMQIKEAIDKIHQINTCN